MEPIKNKVIKLSFIVAGVSSILLGFVPEASGYVCAIANVFAVFLLFWCGTVGIPALLVMIVGELYKAEFKQALYSLTILAVDWLLVGAFCSFTDMGQLMVQQ